MTQRKQVKPQARTIKNPFRPGAGHMPPHLAGREYETKEFQQLLEQDTILKNLILTGLRGLGKTVLLETFKPMAMQSGWLWAGADLSESTSISEEHLATRLLADLSVVTSAFVVRTEERPKPGFAAGTVKVSTTLNYAVLKAFYDATPGLVSDKLKGVLEFVWPFVENMQQKGIVFAYDEAQNLSDHASKGQYPLSLLLDLFQSLQRKNIRYLLALSGLPTLFPKLVEARTFSERMFHIVTLHALKEQETREAISQPIEKAKCPFSISEESVTTIWQVTHGYPYFIQYVCREVFDVWVQAHNSGQPAPGVPVGEIMRKLDTDFFAGRWAKATDRQRELLWVISNLPNCDGEFTVQEIVEKGINDTLKKPFSSSYVNQMLVVLSEAGLVYKNRHGKYSFAVPLLADFIRRQAEIGLDKAS